MTRAGGRIDLAGYAWWPPEPSATVLLGLHGVGGVSTIEWGAAGVPGYSLGHRVAQSGRALVGIDLPGYGASEAAREAATIDDFVFVAAQVADALREGAYAAQRGPARAFPTVVGLGFSMGGIVAVQAQGHLASFDGVVALGWSPAGLRDEAAACIHGSGPCPEGLDFVFVPDNVDPRIVEWALSLPAVVEPGTVGGQLVAWWGCYACVDPRLALAEPAPGPQAAAVARIDVPVLLVQGLADFLIEPTTQGEAEAAFASTTDVTVFGLDRTGHAIQHHLTHEVLYATILEWLAARRM